MLQKVFVSNKQSICFVNFMTMETLKHLLKNDKDLFELIFKLN